MHVGLYAYDMHTVAPINFQTFDAVKGFGGDRKSLHVFRVQIHPACSPFRAPEQRSRV